MIDNDAENPYQSLNDPAAVSRDDEINLPEGQSRGMTGQAAVVGVLMIVQGVLDLLTGLFLGGYAFFAPEFFKAIQAQQQQSGAAPASVPPPEAMMFLSLGMGVMAGFLLILGILLIISGLGVMRFQRRILAMVSLSLGLLTLLSCYCFPTSLLLGIYGMIFLLNQPVALAFQLRGQGYSARRIQQAFLACRV